MNELFWELHLSHDQSRGELLAFFTENGSEIESHTYSFNSPSSKELFATWLIQISKTLFYHESFSDIQFKIRIASPLIYKGFENAILNYVMTIQETQKAIKRNKHLFNDVSSFDHFLFYNVDDLNTFSQLYKGISLRLPDTSHYENFASGWNKFERRWETGNGFSVDELATYLSTHHIRHVFSVNMYYLLHIAKTEHIFLLAFAKACGVEWVTLDYDVYDIEGYGFIQKSAFNSLDFRRFSIWPHATSRMDSLYGNQNVRPFMIGDIKDINKDMSPLQKNSDIVVISHARIQDLLVKLPDTLLFLEHVNPEDPYLDFQKVFHSLLYLLFQDHTLSRIEKERFNAYISNLHINALSFLKYDVLQTLQDHHIRVRLYGDSYWGYLFPEIYQNKFLNEAEMEDLFQTQPHLYLLLNQNYSYFENNPVFLRALNLNVPYLCFPAVVKTEHMKGMSTLEYNSPKQLIEKLPYINQLIKTFDFKNSLTHLKKTISVCSNDFFSELTQTSHKKGYFSLITDEHQILFRQELASYLRSNHERIFRLYDQLVSEKAKNFDINQSRFTKSIFFAKIQQAYEQVKKTAA